MTREGGGTLNVGSSAPSRDSQVLTEDGEPLRNSSLEDAANNLYCLSKGSHVLAEEGEPLRNRSQKEAVNKVYDNAEKGQDGGELEKGQDDDEFEWVELTEDIYSLIFTAPYRSWGFLFCIFIFLFQLTFIALVLWDLLDHYDNESNPLNVPPGVTIQVQVAAAMALLLAVATQGDVIVAAIFLQQGYNPNVQEDFPSATRFKWFLSGGSQFVAGSSFLLTIFVLVMQSSDVVGMMLNFAALSFITEIDEVAFAMAKNGFITNSLEQQVNEVMEFRMPVRRTTNLLRRMIFLFIFFGLMTGYAVITQQQRAGRFLCQSIFLQLGDSFFPVASSFSGIYDQQSTLINDRVTYIERTTKRGMLAYCKEEHAWTLTTWDDIEDDDFLADPCEWDARSPRTQSFDIISTAESTWLISQTESSRSLPLQTFEMYCADCEHDEDPCSGHGECINNKCVCDDYSSGVTCVQEYPCAILAVDERTSRFPDVEGLDLASHVYGLLLDDDGHLVTVYEKPVFVFDHGGYWSVIMFTGRRWIFTLSFFFDTLLDNVTFPVDASKSEVIDFLRSYHAYYRPIIGFFISDPMDVGTPTDKASPVGLGWHRTKPHTILADVSNVIDTSQGIGTVFLCSVCDYESNNCGFGGSCNENSLCECDEGYNGTLCEVSPFS